MASDRYPIERRTGAPAETWLGHKFWAYRTGIMRYVRWCPEIDAEYRENFDSTTYTASARGSYVKSTTSKTAARKFRSRKAAAEAAVKAALATPPTQEN